MNTRWLIRNWFRVGRKISWRLSFQTLISLLYFIPLFKSEWIYRIIQKKNKYIFNYIDSNYRNLLDKYKYCNTDSQVSSVPRIWVMWWQGEESAPEIVKMCIASIRRNANGAIVTMVSKENYRDYVELPEYVLKKHEAGIISFAHLADIMRVFLISQYGGLWLDATIYVSRPIPHDIYKKDFYSLHSIHYKTPFVADDRFYTFVLGGRSSSKIFEFEKDFFSEYCKEHDVMIDYYLLDYSIMYQYFNMADVRSEIDNLEETSESLYDLVNMLNDPYNEKKMNLTLSQNLFSKLKWNGKHLKYKNHKVTNYYMLLKHNMLV